MRPRGDADDEQAKCTTFMSSLVVRQTYLCSSAAILPCIYSMPPSYAARTGLRHLAIVAESCTWFTSITRFHSLAYMHSVTSSGKLAEVRWKRGWANRIKRRTRLRCRVDRVYPLATGVRPQSSILHYAVELSRTTHAYIHRVTEPPAKGCRSTTVVPVYVYASSTEEKWR